MLSLFKRAFGLYTGGMTIENKSSGYTLPPLSDEFLYQVIFCMEDQANEYCIDLKDGVINETVFVESRRELEPQRFLDLPPWYPSDGYRTMEKFVSTLRNPIYRERLRLVLQSGKGVFRQFKDVLAEQPSLERLWYYFKDREIRRLVFYWYERHDEAFRLARLGEEAPEDRPDELIRQDFILTTEVDSYKEEIDLLIERAIGRLNESGQRLDKYLGAQLSKASKEQSDDQFIVALSLSEQFVGFIQYRVNIEESIAVISCYGVEDEFQGLGVFHFLFDALSASLLKRGIREVVLRMIGDSLRIERMFEAANPVQLTKTISISVPRWCDTFSAIDASDYV